MSPMNNRRMVPTQEPGILDFAPGAAAAYSLRNLSLSYSGPVVTVRRSTDSAEADFTASEVSDGTLAAWCSGGDGFVKQWWSQTGSNHCSQGTATNQPQIVDSGSLVTEGGKAAVQFDGTDDYLSATTLTDFALLASIFVVEHATVSAGVDTVIALCEAAATAPNVQGLHRLAQTSGANGLVIQTGDDGAFTNILTSVPPSHKHTAYMIRSASMREGYVDGALKGSSTNTISISGVSVVSLGNVGVDYMSGTLQEAIIYPTDQTALRTRIEGNINRQFGLF